MSGNPIRAIEAETHVLADVEEEVDEALRLLAELAASDTAGRRNPAAIGRLVESPTSTPSITDLAELESRLLDIESAVTSTRLQIEDVHNVLELTGAYTAPRTGRYTSRRRPRQAQRRCYNSEGEEEDDSAVPAESNQVNKKKNPSGKKNPPEKKFDGETSWIQTTDKNYHIVFEAFKNLFPHHDCFKK